MQKAQIFFDTLPSCRACKLILPVVQEIADENGAELTIMDSRDLHDSQTATLPMIYIYPPNDQPRIVLDGTATVGDIEAALGKTQYNFLENIMMVGENAFQGIVEILPSGEVVEVAYEEEKPDSKMVLILILVLIVGVFLYLKFK